MRYGPENHTFAICAYQQSEYLETCIKSLMQQTLKTSIILCTSTPNVFIRMISEKYNIPLFINKAESGLASDWNFALSCAKTSLITLCHQDDYYYENFVETVLKKININSLCIIAYTNYEEDKNGILERKNCNLKIKNLMNFPMRFKLCRKYKWIRRCVLALGNPICCPSVTFNKDEIPKILFDATFKNAVDWDAWERLSQQNGCFVYCKEYLMAHRVHKGSMTTNNIHNNIRQQEDLIMFKRFWPDRIANKLATVFKMSEKNNEQ